MALKDESYFAIELLTFLYKFKDSRWRSDDIERVVSRNNETKSMTKKLNKNSPENDVRRVLKEIEKKRIEIEDKGPINKAIKTLNDQIIIETKHGVGSRITDAGKNLNLFQIIQLFERVGLAPCSQEPESFNCIKKNKGFCLTYELYKKIGDILKKILKRITLEDIVEEKWDIEKILGSRNKKTIL